MPKVHRQIKSQSQLPFFPVGAANGECCIHIEPRVSIYGRAESEWSELADWFVDNGFADPSRGYDKSLTWLIQVSLASQ
jgi:hypothetical protein